MRSTERVRRDIFELMTTPIREGLPIEDLCEGSPFCSCRKLVRVVGGTLLSQYKKGRSTPATRAANAAYMREYRRRQSHGAA